MARIKSSRKSKSSKSSRKSKLSISSLKKKVDKLWSKLVRKKDKKCIRCGKQTNLQAHHIFSRRFNSTRWLLDNGVTLCYGCHMFFAHIEHENFRDMVIEKIGKAKYLQLKQLSNQIKKINYEELSENFEKLKLTELEKENP